MIEKAIRDIILSGIGDLTPMQVNWGERPQGGDWPSIVMHVISGRNSPTFDGPCKLFQGRIQVDIYDTTFLGAKSVANQVKVLLDGYKDTDFQGVFCESVNTSVETGSNEPVRIYRVRLDFFVNYGGNNGQ